MAMCAVSSFTLGAGVLFVTYITVTATGESNMHGTLIISQPVKAWEMGALLADNILQYVFLEFRFKLL